MIDRDTLTEIVERVLDEADEPLTAYATDLYSERDAELAEQVSKLANHAFKTDPDLRKEVVRTLVDSWIDALRIAAWEKIDWYPQTEGEDEP